jgi:ribosomal protein S18 acetylase RimI-like enzyme
MVLTHAQQQIDIRLAQDDDRRQLANLVHFGNRVHRHLDWRPPLDWIGYQPYLVAMQNGRIRAALVCPPGPPGAAWIRLFAVDDFEISADEAWEHLWPLAYDYLRGTTVAAMPLQEWFRRLLLKTGFTQTGQVNMLLWNSQTALPPIRRTGYTIRPMRLSDLPAVQAIDAAAFEPIWQQSQEMLEAAFRQAAIATVAEKQDSPVGYQISTAGVGGGHLARLAIHPDAQQRGIGYALVHNLLTRFNRQGTLQVTVNTQDSNFSSLALYKKAGFHLTGESFPVFQINLD